MNHSQKVESVVKFFIHTNELTVAFEELYIWHNIFNRQIKRILESCELDLEIEEETSYFSDQDEINRLNSVIYKYKYLLDKSNYVLEALKNMCDESISISAKNENINKMTIKDIRHILSSSYVLDADLVALGFIKGFK